MTDNRTTDLREKLDELGIEHFDYDKGGRTQTQWEAPDGKRHFMYQTSNNLAKTARLVIAWHPTPEQAIAATLGSDNEYEAKMDALLCRLTNGKWSKSRAYSLDFMVSCVDEEYETLYAKELAELGSGTCELEQLSALDVTLNMLDSIEWGACSECGCAVPMDAKFCNECGKAVTR